MSIHLVNLWCNCHIESQSLVKSQDSLCIVNNMYSAQLIQHENGSVVQSNDGKEADNYWKLQVKNIWGHLCSQFFEQNQISFMRLVVF